MVLFPHLEDSQADTPFSLRSEGTTAQERALQYRFSRRVSTDRTSQYRVFVTLGITTRLIALLRSVDFLVEYLRRSW